MAREMCMSLWEVLLSTPECVPVYPSMEGFAPLPVHAHMCVCITVCSYRRFCFHSPHSDFSPAFPRTLAEYCPALRSLRVRHCHQVAEPSLSRLRKRGVDIDVEPPLHQALVLLQDMVGFAPFVNLQV